MKAINGELYAPLQFVSAVMPGGAADIAGLRKYDRILEVNGEKCEGATHQFVVNLIRNGGDILNLSVISIEGDDESNCSGTGSFAQQQEENTRYNHPSPIYRRDYSDRRSLPITIPAHVTTEIDGKKVVVYHIYLAARHLCSHRFRAFAYLHECLKDEFSDFRFPKFPGKWPFSLNDQQLDARRRQLEQYLESVCAVRVIAESDTMQDFLNGTFQDESELGVNATQSYYCSPVKVELKILIPAESSTEVVSLQVLQRLSVADVFPLLMNQMGIGEELHNFFGIFEKIETCFERLMHPKEVPHVVFVHNFQTGGPSPIQLRPWVFTPWKIIQLCETNETFAEMLFWTTVHDIDRGVLKIADRELKLLLCNHQTSRNINDFLSLAQTIPGFGDVYFPFCRTDAKKNGMVIPQVGFTGLKLTATNEDGTPTDQCIECSWSEISECQVISGEQTDTAFNDTGDNAAPDGYYAPFFQFVYIRKEKKKNRVIRIFTPWALYLLDCVERIKFEMKEYADMKYIEIQE